MGHPMESQYEHPLSTDETRARRATAQHQLDQEARKIPGPGTRVEALQRVTPRRRGTVVDWRDRELWPLWCGRYHHEPPTAGHVLVAWDNGRPPECIWVLADQLVPAVDDVPTGGAL